MPVDFIRSRVFGSGQVVLTVPHDGGILLPGYLERDETQRWDGESRDTGVRAIASSLFEQLSAGGTGVSLLWSELHRSFVDVNRSPRSQPYKDARLEPVYNSFFRQLDQLVGQALASHQRVAVLDLHGFVFSPGPESYDVVLGSDSYRTAPRHFDRLLLQHVRAQRLSCVFSPDAAQSVSARYRGGWIVRRTAKRWHPAIDACQVELAPWVRDGATNQLGNATVTSMLNALAEWLPLR